MHLRTILRFVLAAVAITLGSQGIAQAAEIKLIAANAIKNGYAELVASFDKSHTVVTTYAGTADTIRRIGAGEVFDLVIIGSDGIDRLVAAGKLVAGSRADFAKSGVGVAVRAGVPKPDVSTSDAVKAAALAAKSIAYSAGPSGLYVGELFRKLGIAEQVASKVKQPSSGAEVAAIVARGEVDLGFAQVSEFLGIQGLTDLGPLPASIQNYTTYSIGLHVGASSSDAAKALINHLRAPQAAPSIRKMGMEPG